MNLAPLTFLFMEGDPGDKMYIIRKGSIRIMKREGAHMATLAELGPGSILGEMSLLDNQPRSATAKTLETTELVVIDQAMLEKTYQSLPTWLTSIIRMIVQRLRETTERKYKDDICNSLPGIFFLLGSYAKTTKGQFTMESVADDLKALYGLSLNDFKKIIAALESFGLVTSSVKPNGAIFLELPKPELVGLISKVYQDRANPKPTGEFQISAEEAQTLQAILNASEKHPQSHGNNATVGMAQVWESFPELQTQNIINLAQAQILQIVPKMMDGQDLAKNHQVAFVSKEIQNLIELHTTLPKLAGPFFEAVKDVKA